MKILSLSTHPHVVSKPQDLRSSSEHKLRYFWWNPRAFWPSIDSKGTTTIKATTKGIHERTTMHACGAADVEHAEPCLQPEECMCCGMWIAADSEREKKKCAQKVFS